MIDLELKLALVSKKRVTREEVISYYQQEYPQEKILKSGKIRYAWKEKLTDKIIEMNPDAKRASVTKRFQKEKGVERHLKGTPSKAQQAEYKAIGETLPRIPPDAIRITGTVCMRYADQECEPRENIDIVIAGDDLEYLLASPDLQTVIQAYMGEALDTENPTFEPCDEYCSADLNIEVAEEEEMFAPKPKKQPKPKIMPSIKAMKRKSVQEGPRPLTPDEVTKLLQ